MSLVGVVLARCGPSPAVAACLDAAAGLRAAAAPLVETPDQQRLCILGAARDQARRPQAQIHILQTYDADLPPTESVGGKSNRTFTKRRQPPRPT